MKNRANTLSAILGNMKDLTGAYESAMNAEGSALKENATYLDSIQGKIDIFNNSVQTMWMNFIDSEVVKFIVDLGTEIVTLTDKLGVLPTAAGAFIGIKAAVQSVKDSFKQLNKETAEGATEAVKESIKSTEQAIQSKEELVRATTDSSRANIVEGITDEQAAAKKKIDTTETIKNTAETIKNTTAKKAGALLVGLGKGLIIGAAVTVATSALTALITAITSASQKMEELTQNAIDSAEELQSTRDSVEDYKGEIDDLRKKLDNSNTTEEEAYNARSRLIEIQDALIDKFGSEAEGINLVTGAIYDQINAIDQLTKAQSDEWLNTNAAAYENAKKVVSKEQTYALNISDFIRDANGDELTQRFQFLAGDFANKLSEMGTDIDLYTSVDDFTGQLEKYLTLSDKTVDEVNSILTDLMNYVRDYSNANNVDYNDLITVLSNARNKYVDEDYLDAKEVYDQGRQQEAYTKYASEYGKILDAQEEFYYATTNEDQLDAIKKYNEGIADAFKSAGGEITDGIFTIDEDSANAHMQKYFLEMQNKFAEQEFTLQVSLNEEGLNDQIKEIMQQAGESGLSALDNNQILDMVNRGLNVEGATDASGQYTQDQINGLVQLQAVANNAGISIESVINSLTSLGLISGSFATEVEAVAQSSGQAYSMLSDSVSKHSEIASTLNDAVYDNVEISKEQYESLQELIGSYDEFSDCIDDNQGYIVKDTQLLKKLINESKKSTSNNIKLARSQARLQYYEKYKELQKLTNGTKVTDAATLSYINSLYAEMGAIAKTIAKYSMLEQSLLGATNAYEAFELAQSADSETNYMQSAEDMMMALGEAFSTAELGTETAQAAIAGLVPESVYAGLDTLDAKMSAIHQYFAEGNLSKYFTLEFDDNGALTSAEMKLVNLKEFIEDGLGAGVFDGADWQNFDFDEGFLKGIQDAPDKLQAFADKMNVTKEVAFAFFKAIEDHDIEWLDGDYSSLMEELVPPSLEKDIYDITTALADLEYKLATGEISAEEYGEQLLQLGAQADQTAERARNNIVAWKETNDKISEAQQKLTELTSGDEAEIKANADEITSVSEQLGVLLRKKAELEEPAEVDIQFASDSIQEQIAQWQADNAQLMIDVVPKIVQDDEGEYVLPATVKATLDQSERDSINEYLSLLNDQYIINSVAEVDDEDAIVQMENLQTTVDSVSQAINNIPDPDVNTTAAVQAVNDLKTAIQSIEDKTVYVTTVTSTVSGTNGDSELNGTAHVTGTAHATGNWGLKQSEQDSLVGELGPEMVVDPHTGRYYTVGDNGAEMVDLPKGAIIFNHKQTEELLKNGRTASRGKAYAEGNAHVTIWPNAASKDQWEGTGSSALNNAAGAMEDAADEFREVFDWIEVRLEEITDAINLNSAKIENAVGYVKKNKLTDEAIDLSDTLYDNLIAAANRYYSYASSILADIPAQYREAAKNGAIAIEEFTGDADEKTIEAIQEYREWVQKGSDAEQRAEETLTEISTYAKQGIDNIAQDYENKNSLRNNKIDQLEAYNDLSEATLGYESEDIYSALIKENNKNIKSLQEQRDKMQAELNKQVEQGNIKKYSQDWYDAVNDIQAVDTEILELTADTKDYQEAANNLHWDKFDDLLSRYESISDEADNLIDILGNSDLFDESGAWTDEGIASLGLYAQKMEAAEVQANKYKEEINYLNKNWQKLGYTEKEYIEKLDELKEGQYDSIKAYEESKEAIVDMTAARVEAIKEGIQKEIDAYEELIDKQKESLNAEKDMHDFQKTVMDQQKNISDIERQLAAIAGDTSMSAAARRKKLEAELAEAKYELEEIYYDRSIENQQEALDKELEQFQDAKNEEIEGWDTYLENTNQVVSDALNTVQANTTVVYQVLKDLGKEYSLDIADALTSPWQDGETAIQSFSDKFGLSMSSTVEELQKVEIEFKKVMDEIRGYADEAIGTVDKNASDTISANQQVPDREQQVDPNPPAASGSNSGASNNNSGSSSNAGMISNISAWLKQGNSGSDVRKLQQVLNDLGFNAGTVDGIFGYNTKQALMRFQSSSKYGGAISADGILGPDTKKKFRVAGYARGTTGVKNSQLAIVDELGEEIQLVPDGNGRIEYLKKGTSVLPADISKNLMAIGSLDPSSVLDRSRPSIGVSPSVINNTTSINIDASVAELIHVEHMDGNNLNEITKVVDKAWDKKIKELNGAIRKYVR